MAEKYVIFEAEIDTSKATAAVRALKNEEAILKSQQELARKQTGELSNEYIAYSASLKSVQGELRKAETTTRQVIDANIAQTGSIDQMRLQLSLVTKQWSALSKEERENGEEGKRLSKLKLDLTNQLKGEEKATGDTRRNVGNYTEGMNEATSAMTQFVPGAGKAATAAKTLGAAFKVMLGPVGIAIAIIAAVVAAVKSFFESSEEGQNKLAVFSAAFSAAFGVINDILSMFGGLIVSAFEDPQKAIADLWEAIKTNIINRFTGLIDMAKGLGKVLKGVFTLDWDLLKEGAAEYGESFVQALTGVDNLIGKVIDGAKKLGNEIEDKAKKAMMLAKLQADLDKRVRDSVVKNAKDAADIFKLKNQIEEKATKTIEERLALLDEVGKLETDIENRNVEIAKQKYQIKKEQNKLSLSNKDALNEEANLLAAIYTAEAAADSKRKEMITKRQELLNGEKAALRELAEVAVNNMNFELEKYKQSLDKRQGLTAKGVEDEINILRAALQIKTDEIDAAENISNELKTARKLELDNQYLLDSEALTLAFKEQQKARDIETAQIDYNNELSSLQNNLFGKLELERQGLEAKRKQELEAAEYNRASILLINDKYDQQELELERIKQDAKLDLAAGFAGNLATIFGESTKVGKAAAAAETVINTYKGAMAAYSSLAGIPIVGPVLGIAAAGAAIKTGFDAVKKIYAVKATGGTTPSAPTVSSAATPSMSAAASTPALTQAQQAVIPQTASSIAGQSMGGNGSTQQSGQQVLVTDDVTAKQMNIARNQRLANLT